MLTIERDLPPHGSSSFDVGIVATDGHGATATGTVSGAMTLPNANPVASFDDLGRVSVDDGEVVIPFSAFLDNDTDADGDTLSVAALFTEGSRGTFSLEADGVHYSAAPGFDFLAPGENAVDDFQYSVTDGLGGYDYGFANIDVYRPESMFGATLDYRYAYETRGTTRLQPTSRSATASRSR